jgi:hypothetical protein
MHEYIVIRDAIKTLGASVVEEHLHPESFGSAYCIFEGSDGLRFRLVWDGKEGYGFLQSLKQNNTWQDAGPFVSGVSNPLSPKFVALLAVAETFVRGHAAI